MLTGYQGLLAEYTYLGKKKKMTGQFCYASNVKKKNKPLSQKSSSHISRLMDYISERLQ